MLLSSFSLETAYIKTSFFPYEGMRLSIRITFFFHVSFSRY